MYNLFNIIFISDNFLLPVNLLVKETCYKYVEIDQVKRIGAPFIFIKLLLNEFLLMHTIREISLEKQLIFTLREKLFIHNKSYYLRIAKINKSTVISYGKNLNA